MTKAMKRLAVLAITSTLGLLPQGASAQSCNWPAWDSYKKAMMSSDGRIIDGSSAQMITTSEGQSYGLFFALLGNDKKATPDDSRRVVQVAAFKGDDKAKQIAQEVNPLGLPVYVSRVGNMARVHVGPYRNPEDAQKAQAKLRSSGHNAMIMRYEK